MKQVLSLSCTRCFSQQTTQFNSIPLAHRSTLSSSQILLCAPCAPTLNPLISFDLIFRHSPIAASVALLVTCHTLSHFSYISLANALSLLAGLARFPFAGRLTRFCLQVYLHGQGVDHLRGGSLSNSSNASKSPFIPSDLTSSFSSFTRRSFAFLKCAVHSK